MASLPMVLMGIVELVLCRSNWRPGKWVSRDAQVSAYSMACSMFADLFFLETFDLLQSDLDRGNDFHFGK